MKKWSVLACFACIVSGFLFAQTPAKHETQDTKIQSEIPDVDEEDTTDVYAIPLDTSVEEERIEESQLEKTAKEIKAEKNLKAEAKEKTK